MEIILEKVNLNKPIVFIGLPGIGLVGKIAIDTIVKKTKAKKIGAIKGSFFPPVVFVEDSGRVRESSDQVYHCKIKNQDFLFIVGDFQPNLNSIESFPSHYLFAKGLSQFLKKIDAKEIYSFAGINVGDARITKIPELYFAVNKFAKSDKLKTKLKPVAKNTTISGIAGLILSESEKFDLAGTCILSETSAKIYGDFESAKALLLFVQDFFEIKIDMKEVEEEAKKISQAFKQVIKELKKITDSATQEPQTKPTYVR